MVRHGQTDFSRENRFCGALDPPLNDVGLRMAEAFGEHWSKRKWDAVYCSPRLRTRQTAEALTRRQNLSMTIVEGLAEIAYGAWEGMRHEDAKTRFPEEYSWWAADTASRATPGGETAFAVAARATPLLERIRTEHSEGRVLLVSHKATIRILTCALLGMDVRLFRDRIAQPVVGVTSFELKKTGPLLTMLGSVEHLPPDLRDIEGT